MEESDIPVLTNVVNTKEPLASLAELMIERADRDGLAPDHRIRMRAIEFDRVAKEWWKGLVGDVRYMEIWKDTRDTYETYVEAKEQVLTAGR